MRHLASLLFVHDARLLAQGGAKNDRPCVADESSEVADEPVHCLVAKENSLGELALLFPGRLQRERLGLHVSPVHVLEVSGAIKEEGREMRSAPTIDSAEEVELESVHDSRAPPPIFPGPLGHE